MIKEKLKLVPDDPGCYLMKNKDNQIIYVGKAKNLKKRLSSYFRGTHSGKTAKLISEIVDFEYTVVTSEKESLILEINLIKENDPKYNILLRDDKSYPYIELTDESVPRLLIIRNLNKKKSHSGIYGPFPNVTAARTTVNLLNRTYPLRKCRVYEKKPCLYYYIGECLGYCSNIVDKEEIKKMKIDIARFLKGDHSLITKKIETEMLEESNKMNYEKARELKELLDYIVITLSKQKVEINDDIDRDVFGYYIDKGYLSIQVFFIRSGKILERHSKIIPLIEEETEELTNYIAHFYEKNFILPKEIFVPSIVDFKLLEEYLNIKVVNPIKGKKHEILEMANNNAKITLDNSYDLITKDESRTVNANNELKNILKLDKLDRIEIFDNSHLFGTFNVSGMVVFTEGVPNKNEYRKYKLSDNSLDEYSMMNEVIYRRYFRVIKDNLTVPDLIIVDGGIGQINIARSILESLNLNIMVVGLVKDNKHSTSALLAFDPLEEIKIDKKSILFYYLERMQDEVHKFTISYHKQIRSKGSLESIFDNIDGIGNVRRKELLKKYKSINKLKEISLEELQTMLPDRVASNLKNYLEKM